MSALSSRDDVKHIPRRDRRRVNAKPAGRAPAEVHGARASLFALLVDPE
jgi:hypothetical protein